MKRIKIWQNEGLEADPLFSEILAYLEILDDDSLWNEYDKKRQEVFELSQKIIQQLRPPTDIEIEEYRQRINAELMQNEAEWRMRELIEKRKSESHTPSECPAKAEGEVRGCGNCRELTGDSY